MPIGSKQDTLICSIVLPAALHYLQYSACSVGAFLHTQTKLIVNTHFSISDLNFGMCQPRDSPILALDIFKSFLQILILCKVMQMSVEQNRAEANNSYQSPQRQQMKELMNSEFEPHPNCYSASEYRIQLKSDDRSCEPSFSTRNHYLHVLIDSQESIKREFSICMRKIMLTKMV